jgi:hypothetical protein
VISGGRCITFDERCCWTGEAVVDLDRKPLSGLGQDEIDRMARVPVRPSVMTHPYFSAPSPRLSRRQGPFANAPVRSGSAVNSS